ncbi:hypothetical protein C8R47DRAFT_1074066 [Mycena vitilis]|nr:hypothetical protein C8R47DRAFT_1074066 [Mycena vitilis]
MLQGSHSARLAAAQTVFRVSPPNETISTSQTVEFTTPDIPPTEETISRFWRRVAELSTRYYDAERKWICGKEIRQWNKDNRKACFNCLRSKNRKTCIVDDDQPSCRTCREFKLGCDRKQLFLFDLTKNDFFSSYDQFLKVFRAKPVGRLRRYGKKACFTTKEGIISRPRHRNTRAYQRTRQPAQVG